MSTLDRIKARLFTHEDHYNIHKILGITTVSHYIYRYYTYFVKGDTYNFSFFNLFFLIITMMLPLTSFFFNVRKEKNISVIIIDKETRLHSVSFSWRSCTLILYLWLVDWISQSSYNESLTMSVLTSQIVRTMLVLFWHVVADEIREEYGVPGHTTVRSSKPALDRDSPDNKLRDIAYLYAESTQLVAIYMLIFKDTMSAFAIIPAIQLYAFLGTLRKKGFISNMCLAIIYNLVLLIMYAVFPFDWISLILIPIAIVLRFKFRLNKYVLWLGISGIGHYLYGL